MIPDFFYDPQSKKRYERGRLLGKGAFAECYELTDSASKNIYAGKIVSKKEMQKNQLLQESYLLDRLAEEIYIHRWMVHTHIVGFHSYFEVPNYYVIVLDLCEGGSLMELHKRRKAITEPEARCFMHQLFLGVRHLHMNNIIHRDLKLSNLFLTEKMELKIGDFGLATKIDGERRKTLCGTPNYIAPEVLFKTGHSYEADIWSMGCILYTLLVGHPPFETQSHKDTYSKINKNEFDVPSSIGPLARALIIKMLQEDPSKRPNVQQCLEDDFMKGDMPSRLHLFCVTEPPNSRLNKGVIAVRRPLGGINRDYAPISKEVQGVKGQVNSPPFPAVPSGQSPQQLLRDLQQQLFALHINAKTNKGVIRMELAEDRTATPMVWAFEWVYCKQYGFGYKLTNDTIGVIFDDSSKLLLHADRMTIQHVEKDGNENFHSMKRHPPELKTKMKMFGQFLDHMGVCTIGNGNDKSHKENLAHLPYVHKWMGTQVNATVMHLDNGTLQIVYQDGVSIVICPVKRAVSVNDPHYFRTFLLESLAKYGCSIDLLQRLEYARETISSLLSAK